jgi:predicted O-methyltransferase YrrM
MSDPTRPSEPELPPPAQLMQLATGYFTARAIHVAATLGIADLLDGGARDADDLARATGTHAPTLYRLLRALAAAGVLEHAAGDRFALTAIGATLRERAADSTRAGVLMFHHPMFWRSWEELLYSVRTGRPALDRVFGKPVFEYLAATPDAAAAYDGGMTGLNRAIIPAIVAAGEFTRFNVIVDVAGGHGSLLAAILAAAPRACGILVDLAHVTDVARANLAGRGLAERAEVVTGSMFESVPTGGDAYVLKWILHDWDDAACVAILENIRAAIAPGGRLLVVERVLPERAAASPAMRSAMMADLLMLVHLTGRERTEREFRALLETSGFRLDRVVPTGTQLAIIEAAPR